MKVLFLTYIDDEYAYPLKVMLTSLLDTNSSFNYDFKVLSTKSLEKSDKDDLIKIYNKIQFDVIDLKEYSKYTKLINSDRFKTDSYNAFGRFEMFNYEEYDKLIYLDTDIIVGSSLDYLIKECSQEECYAVKHETNNYFNAGVLVINKKTTFKEYKNRCLTILSNREERVRGNQDILNRCFNAYYIENKYNLNVGYKNCDAILSNKEAVIYHYPGEGKPWLKEKFSKGYNKNSTLKSRELFLAIWNYYDLYFKLKIKSNALR